jgi:membrane protein DedA with SNARE-associated domain
MNLGNVLHQTLSFVGTFNPTIVVFLFLICSIGEFGASVPYLLETVWLMSGYSFGAGLLSFFQVVLLWLVAQVGRQTGAIMLYHLSRFGTMPLIKLYNKHFGARLSEKLSGSSVMPFNFLRRLNYLSPFSVALGRLFGLRIPLTLTLGVKRQLETLLLGVLLSSLVWDGIYISLGIVVGANVVLEPFQMILYSLAGLTLLYVTNFAVRRLLRLRISKNGVK